MNVITSVQPITLGAAEAQQEEIRRIMAEQGLNFGPAVDYLIRERHSREVDRSGWDAA